MPAVELTTTAEVGGLVDDLLRPTRTEPIVVVTTQNRQVTPLIDADALASAVAPIPVYLLVTGPLTRELTTLLPDELGVYGGAARVWLPGLTASSAREDHPIAWCYRPEDSPRAIARLQADLERWEHGRWQQHVTPPPAVAASREALVPVGATVSALVLEALPGGAELSLGGGLHGWLVRRSKDPLLAEGESIEVRVLGYDGTSPILERLPAKAPPAPAAMPAETSATVPGQSRPRPGPPGVAPAPPAIQKGAAEPDVTPELVRLIAEVTLLRDQLADANERAHQAEAELTGALKDNRRTAQDLKKDLRRHKDRVEHLERQLHGTGRFEDAETQLRHEIALAWEATHHGSDRDTWPLPDYAVGVFFLSSMDALSGISRPKIIEVLVEVLTGRAATNPARELHVLRTGEGGSDPQRVRPDDGARAWRASLQSKTPSARRMHFWRLPNGRAELANVVTHDDLTIA